MLQCHRSVPVRIFCVGIVRVEGLAVLGHEQDIVLQGHLGVVVCSLPHSLFHRLEVDGVLYDIVVPRGIVLVDGANVRPGPGLVLDLSDDLQERGLDVLGFLLGSLW